MNVASQRPTRSKHTHPHDHGILSIDRIAGRSRLKTANPVLKTGFAVSVLLLCVAADSPALSLLVMAGMLAVVVFCGGTPFWRVSPLLRLPALFISVSCAAIAVNLSASPLGFFDVAVFRFYLCVTPSSLRQAGALFLKAYGAVSCLYFLCLTTTMNELISVLKRMRIPSVIIELMYLVYRYIFLLSDTQRGMTTAAESRLGFSGWKATWHTFVHVGGNLLAVSFRRSRGCFDAMESRCYDGTLSFLTAETPVKRRHLLLFTGGFGLYLALACFLKLKGWDLF